MMEGPILAALRGDGAQKAKVFFFAAGQYWRYDLAKDYGEVDYPRPLAAANSEWKLPEEFSETVDACLSGRGVNKGKAFFFCGGRYAIYDRQSRKFSELRSLEYWSPRSPFPFPGGVDTAFDGGGQYAGKSYFFKGRKYARYDWRDERFDLLNQDVSAWNIGNEFANGVNSAITVEVSDTSVPYLIGAPGLAGVDVPGFRPPARPVIDATYFFKDQLYVKYDWRTGRAFEGYPILIAAGWPTGCAVWASHSQAPTLVCTDDSRLEKGTVTLAYPYGNLKGQAGWQVATRFATIAQLTLQLRRLTVPAFYGDDRAGDDDYIVPKGRITRLGINAHGHGGAVLANGESRNAGRTLKIGEDLDRDIVITDDKLVTDNALKANLGRVNEMLAPGAAVIIFGCESAQTLTGSNFIRTLSERFPDHPVTGFTSLGWGGFTDIKRSEGCFETGMRDTGILTHRGVNVGAKVAAKWSDLQAMPWASEHSPCAKTAFNNKIIRQPTGGDLP